LSTKTQKILMMLPLALPVTFGALSSPAWAATSTPSNAITCAPSGQKADISDIVYGTQTFSAFVDRAASTVTLCPTGATAGGHPDAGFMDKAILEIHGDSVSVEFLAIRNIMPAVPNLIFNSHGKSDQAHGDEFALLRIWQLPKTLPTYNDALKEVGVIEGQIAVTSKGLGDVLVRSGGHLGFTTVATTNPTIKWDIKDVPVPQNDTESADTYKDGVWHSRKYGNYRIEINGLVARLVPVGSADETSTQSTPPKAADSELGATRSVASTTGSPGVAAHLVCHGDWWNVWLPRTGPVQVHALSKKPISFQMCIANLDYGQVAKGGAIYIVQSNDGTTHEDIALALRAFVKEGRLFPRSEVRTSEGEKIFSLNSGGNPRTLDSALMLWGAQRLQEPLSTAVLSTTPAASTVTTALAVSRQVISAPAPASLPTRQLESDRRQATSQLGANVTVRTGEVRTHRATLDVRIKLDNTVDVVVTSLDPKYNQEAFPVNHQVFDRDGNLVGAAVHVTQQERITLTTVNGSVVVSGTGKEDPNAVKEALQQVEIERAAIFGENLKPLHLAYSNYPTNTLIAGNNNLGGGYQLAQADSGSQGNVSFVSNEAIPNTSSQIIATTIAGNQNLDQPSFGYLQLAANDLGASTLVTYKDFVSANGDYPGGSFDSISVLSIASTDGSATASSFPQQFSSQVLDHQQSSGSTSAWVSDLLISVLGFGFTKTSETKNLLGDLPLEDDAPIDTDDTDESQLFLGQTKGRRTFGAATDMALSHLRDTAGNGLSFCREMATFQNITTLGIGGGTGYLTSMGLKALAIKGAFAAAALATTAPAASVFTIPAALLAASVIAPPVASAVSNVFVALKNKVTGQANLEKGWFREAVQRGWSRGWETNLVGSIRYFKNIKSEDVFSWKTLLRSATVLSAAVGGVIGGIEAIEKITQYAAVLADVPMAATPIAAHAADAMTASAPPEAIGLIAPQLHDQLEPASFASSPASVAAPIQEVVFHTSSASPATGADTPSLVSATTPEHIQSTLVELPAKELPVVRLETPGIQTDGSVGHAITDNNAAGIKAMTAPPMIDPIQKARDLIQTEAFKSLPAGLQKPLIDAVDSGEPSKIAFWLKQDEFRLVNTAHNLPAGLEFNAVGQEVVAKYGLENTTIGHQLKGDGTYIAEVIHTREIREARDAAAALARTHQAAHQAIRSAAQHIPHLKAA